MNISLAQRVSRIQEPQTIAMAKLSRELASKGLDVINLSLGEPDFITPDHIREAAQKALEKGYTFYTPVAGIPELRQAICDKFLRDNNLQYSPEQIVVSTGAKQSIMNLIMALINEGDEVIIPTPYWVSYSEMVKLAGGIPVFIHAPVEQDYKITAHQLELAITPKTKAFLFSSPCNPTGSVYHRHELEQLARVFIRYPHIHILSDEIYEYILFDGKHVSIAELPEMKDRTSIINGMSKGFAMTGWRIGYIATSTELAKACEKIQAQFTSGTNSIAQHASVAALSGTYAPTRQMCQAYKTRKNLVIQALQQMPGVKCNMPEGAFYAFPDMYHYFGKSYQGNVIHNATDLCMFLLHHAHVSLVTGDAFGAPHCVRMSFATNEEKLATALHRIKNTLALLV